MSQLGNGNLWFGVSVQDLTDDGLRLIKDKLEKLSVNISNVSTGNLQGQVQSALSSGTYNINNVTLVTTALKNLLDTFFKSYKGSISKYEIDEQALRSAVSSKLSSAFTISVSPNITTKTFDLKPNQALLRQSVKTALESAPFDVSVTPKVKNKAVVHANEAELRNSISRIIKAIPASSVMVNAVLNNPNLKVTADTATMISDIEKALKNGSGKKGYGIQIYVDQMKLSTAVQRALNSMNLVPNSPTTGDLRQAKMAAELAKAAAQEALAQRRLQGAANGTAKAYSKLNLGMGVSISMALNLRNILSNLFSTYMMKQFISNLIEIGGEFQKQQVALRAMLGDVGKADQLFSQLKGLAIESPFKFSELASYGKQLAAFSVPYEELYDTTKRLSDISAGLGVDMSRIILAFGQIRSAKVLKGTELRQLTEAGIPMVDALSKKLSELEGRAVSASEVFARISKKEISFDMVKDVLWEMTNVGGQFYNMQEELTKTLSGRWAKFVDSYEIALSEIANSNNGILTNVIDLMTKLVGCFDKVAYSAIAFGSSMMTFKLILGAASYIRALTASVFALSVAQKKAVITNGLYTANMTMFEKSTVKAVLNLKKLVAAFKSLSGIGIEGALSIVSAFIIGIATYVSLASSELDKLNDKLNEIRGKSSADQNSLTFGYASLVNELSKAKEGTEKYKGVIKQINSTYGSYLDKLWDESSAYRDIRESIDDVTEAIRRKKDMEAVEQERSAVDDYMSEQFANTRTSLEKELKAQIGDLDDTTIKKMANEMTMLIQKGYGVQEAMHIVFTELNNISKTLDDTAVNRLGFETLGTVGGHLSFYLKQYQELIKKQNEWHESIDKIHNGNYTEQEKTIAAINEKYEQLKRNQKDETAKTEIEIARLKELRDYYTAPAGFNKTELTFKRWGTEYSPTVKSVRQEAEETAVTFKRWGAEVNGVYDSLELLSQREWKFGKGLQENSKEVKKLDSEIKAAELSMQEWVVIATELANTPHLGELGIEATAKSLAPSEEDQTNLLGFLQNLAEKVSEAKTKIEELNKIPIALRNPDSWGLDYALANATVQFGKGIEDKFNISLSDFEKSKNKNKNTSTKDAQNEKWKNRISLIKEAYSEFKKWESLMGRQEALEKVNESGIFSELGDRLPTNIEEYRKLLTELQDEMGDPSKLTEQRKQTYRSLLQAVFGIDYDKSKDEFDAAEKMMSEYISNAKRQFGIYKNFVDATGDRNLASSIAFGANTLDTNAKLYSDFIKEQLRGQVGNLDYTSLFGLSDDELTRRFNKNGKVIKSLLDELKEAMQSEEDEEHSLYLKSLEDVSDYYSQRAKIIRDYQKQINAARKFGNNELAGRLEQKRDSELMQIDPQTIKFYSAALAMTRDEMQKVAETLKTDLVRQMMNGAISGDEFYKSMSKINKVVDDFDDHMLEKKFQTSRLDASKSDKLSFSLDDVEAEINAASIDIAKYQAILNNVEAGSNEAADATDKLAKAQKRYDDAVNKRKSIKEQLKDWKNFENMMDNVSVILNAASNALGDLSSMFKALGKEATGDTLDMIKGVTDSVNGMVDSIAKGDPVSIIGGVVSGISGIITSIAGYHDKKLDRAIQQSVLEVKKLGNEYKNLEKIIERQLGSVTRSQSKELLENLKRQYKEVNSELLNEEDKKDSDQGAIEDYKQQLNELREQINYFYEDIANDQYGVDIKSWADDIASAITDAFAAGEDAAEAFDDAVGDIMKDIVNKMISLNVIQPAMEKLRNYMFGDNGIFTDNSDMGTDLSPQEIIGLTGELSKLKDNISKSKEIWDKINDATGGMLEETSKNSGGLSAGIKGITENTADLLASYVNGIRSDVSKIVQLEEAISSAMGLGAISQEQITRLDQIAQNTLRSADAATEIQNILNSVTNGIKKLAVK